MWVMVAYSIHLIGQTFFFWTQVTADYQFSYFHNIYMICLHKDLSVYAFIKSVAHKNNEMCLFVISF